MPTRYGSPDATMRTLPQRQPPVNRSMLRLLLVPSSSSVVHQRRNLHELDTGAHAVETRYALQKRIGKKGFGCVLRVPNVEVCGLALCGIDRKSFGTQSGHSLKPCACSLGDLPHGLLIEIVSVAKRYKHTDHAGTPF